METEKKNNISFSLVPTVIAGAIAIKWVQFRNYSNNNTVVIVCGDHQQDVGRSRISQTLSLIPGHFTIKTWRGSLSGWLTAITGPDILHPGPPASKFYQDHRHNFHCCLLCCRYTADNNWCKIPIVPRTSLVFHICCCFSKKQKIN